jgi:predicted dehydrogenase
VSPEVEFVRKLVADGYVGEVLSSTYIGCSSVWGDEVTSGEAYAMDATNGVTLLSIIGGHAISAIQRVLGQITEVAAITAQRRRNVRVVETGQLIPMTAADQVLISAVLHSGAPLAFQLRGGSPHGTKLRWEINGIKGDLRITARFEPVPVINISPLRVEGGQKNDEGYAELNVPESYYFDLEDQPVARNVTNIYRLMAKDLRDGTRTAPGIDDAVSLHRTLWAIEESANTGRRVSIG